jgi:[acyl-carrier-protein] S-malonyltransferase
MAPAVAALAEAAATAVVKDPSITLLSNRDGGIVTTGASWVERIVAQVAAPVRWDLCMQAMTGLGVTALIELVPGGTLAGLAKRALPDVERLALKTPDQLDAARELFAGHAAGTTARSGGNGSSPESKEA